MHLCSLNISISIATPIVDMLTHLLNPWNQDILPNSNSNAYSPNAGLELDMI